MATITLVENTPTSAIVLDGNQNVVAQNDAASDQRLGIQVSLDGTTWAGIKASTIAPGGVYAFTTAGYLFFRFNGSIAGNVTYSLSQATASTNSGLTGLIADGNMMAYTPHTGLTAGVYATDRRYHRNLSGKAIKTLRLVFQNFSNASSTESVTANQMTVKAAIQRMGTSVTDQTGERVLVTFNNGQLSAILDPGGFIVSDPIPFDLGVGEIFYTLTASTPTSGTTTAMGQLELAGANPSAGNPGRNTGEGRAASDVTGSGTVTVNNNNQAYTPFAVLGVASDGSRPASFAIIGDSIAANSSDDGFARDSGGWVARAFGGWSGYDGLTALPYSAPFLKLGIGGESAQQVASLDNLRLRSFGAGYCTHEVHQHGTNDVGASTTVANMKIYMLNLAVKAMVAGRRVIRCTILPRATSTDGFKTVANQVHSYSNEANRISINQWIRDTSSSGFVAQARTAALLRNPSAVNCMVLDLCAPIEVNSAGVLTADGGWWLPYTGATAITDVAGAASTTSAVKVGGTAAANLYRGYSLRRVANNEIRAVWYHAADSSGVITLQIRNAFSTMSAGDSLELSLSPVADGTGGIHPGSTGHKIIGDYVNGLLPVLASFF